jgi:hypothetical protein
VITIRCMQLDPSLRSNVTMTHDAGGHMMCIDRKAPLQLRQDVVKFIDGAVPD